MPMKLEELKVKGKRVLVRVDFNVPLNKDYSISDFTRIEKALPTLEYLQKEGASIILMSHLGRPQKKLNEDGTINKEKFTLRHLVEDLSKRLDTKVQFSESAFGKDATDKSLALKEGEVLLIENTRFHKQEAKGDLEFASRLAALGDFYVNDAFGTAHRAHASTTTVARFFPMNKKSFGYLLENEIKNADILLNSPKRPVTAIVGGAKVSDKIQLLDRLVEKVNTILIGGGMAYTFVKAQGGSIGQSLCEDDFLELSLEILAKAKANNVEIVLPTDTMCTEEFKDVEGTVYPTSEIPDHMMGLDVGPDTIENFGKHILKSSSILWNGPLGVFEFKNYARGTYTMAEKVAEATSNGAYSLIGGGDSVSAINKSGLADKVSHISTGGGAMLEYLEGKTLPGIKAILS